MSETHHFIENLFFGNQIEDNFYLDTSVI